MSEGKEPVGSTVVQEERKVVIPTRPQKTGWVIVALTGSVLWGFFAVLGYLMKYTIPEENKEIVLQMVETVKNITIMVVSYHVGTTVGSERKTDMLAKAGPVDPH